MPENYVEFRGLLRGAICNRTQAQFASESGISVEHLNRMLNAETIHRPTKTTLMKIAAVAKNGITYKLLQDAVDKEDNGAQASEEEAAARLEQAKRDFTPDFRDLANQTMESLCHVISNRALPCISSLSDFMEGVLADVKADKKDNLDISFDLGRSFSYMCEAHNYAKEWVSVDLTMSDRWEVASSELLLYFTTVPGANGEQTCLVQGVSTAVKDIMELFGMPPAAIDAHEDDGSEGDDSEDCSDEAFKLALADRYYLDFQEPVRFRELFIDKNAKTKGEKILSALIGVETTYSKTTDGFGFWLEETPPNFLDFVSNHLSDILAPYISQPENYEALSKGLTAAIESENAQAAVDVLNQAEYRDDSINTDSGWGAAIAVAMIAVTGFPYCYYAPAEDLTRFTNLSKHGCIIIPIEDSDCGRIQRETIIRATGLFAKELGIKRFGDILFTGVETVFRMPKTYTFKEPNSEKKREQDDGFDLSKADYSEIFSPENKGPKQDGLYAVKLKDGRHKRCIFLINQGVWIMNHREWSDLIEAWCPNPIPLPKPKKTDEDKD